MSLSKILKERREVSVVKEWEMYSDSPCITDFAVMFKYLNKEGS